MNAPDTLKPLPLIVALAGAPNSGRKTIAKYLKHHHGFASTSFATPLYEGIQYLYGVSPSEILFGDQDRPIERLGKSPRELVVRLREHAEATAGADFLTRRLVERTVARGAWGQQDIVISDLSSAEEVQWVRLMRGQVWWVRRTAPAAELVVDSVERLFLEHFQPDDLAIINEDLAGLDVDIETALRRAREANMVPVR